MDKNTERNQLFFNAYRDEALDLIDKIESSVLDLESDPGNMELVNTIFRGLHTVKGSGSMVGAKAASEFSHNLENMFSAVRDGQLTPQKTIIDISLASIDILKSLVNDRDSVLDDSAEAVIRKIKEILQSEPSYQNKDTVPVSEPRVIAKTDETEENRPILSYRVHFEPQANIFLVGGNPMALVRQVAGMGDHEIILNHKKIPSFFELNPEYCYLEWDILVTTDRTLDEIREVFVFFEEQSKIEIKVIDDAREMSVSAEYKKIGEILAEKKVIDEETLGKFLPHKTGDILVEKNLAAPDDVQSALTEQAYVRRLREGRKEKEVSATIRVGFEKLDALVNLTGEMVTTQARLGNLSRLVTDREFLSLIEQFDRLTNQLRDLTMHIRMVPLETLFSSFNRLVRDLGGELGKSVSLKVSGGDTELDKNMLEILRDPLVHILRNSLDHGIESPEMREKNGKQKEATVSINAKYEGNSVVISVSDDGRGLDSEKILAKAIEKGLASKSDKLSEKDIHDLIFLPGFSTSETTTSVSGRGVGMDVVRTNIGAIHGEVDVESRPGQGTTITLRIPLTLAIIDGLLVAVGEETYLFNIDSVLECGDDIIWREDSRTGTFPFRDELIPLVCLRSVFGLPPRPGITNQLVVAKSAKQKVGILVDRILGQYQTVIKPLTDGFRKSPAVSGAAILGDGSIAMILEINKLISSFV